jgi:cell division protein FtsB
MSDEITEDRWRGWGGWGRRRSQPQRNQAPQRQVYRAPARQVARRVAAAAALPVNVPSFKPFKLNFRIKSSNKLSIPSWMFTRKFLSMEHMKSKARVISLQAQKKKVAKDQKLAATRAKAASKKVAKMLAAAQDKLNNCKSSVACQQAKSVFAALKLKVKAEQKNIDAQVQDMNSQVAEFNADYKLRMADAQKQLKAAITKAKSGKKQSKGRKIKLLKKAKNTVHKMRTQLSDLQNQVSELTARNGILTAALADYKSGSVKAAVNSKQPLTLSEANQLIARILARVKNNSE